LGSSFFQVSGFYDNTQLDKDFPLFMKDQFFSLMRMGQAKRSPTMLVFYLLVGLRFA
jgi:hypothetical protein